MFLAAACEGGTGDDVDTGGDLDEGDVGSDSDSDTDSDSEPACSDSERVEGPDDAWTGLEWYPTAGNGDDYYRVSAEACAPYREDDEPCLGGAFDE